MKRWMKWLIFIVLIVIAVVLLTPNASAQLVYDQGDTFNLKIPCEYNGTYCSGASVCKLTYISPDTTTLVDNQVMTNNGAYHNYTIYNTSETGIYTATVTCEDQGWNGLSTFEILITPNGEIPTTGKSIVDLAMLFALVVLLIFSIMSIFYVGNINGKFALYWLSHLLAIAVSFIAWQTSSGILSYSPFVGDFFRIMFLVLLIAFLPMVFLSIFFIIKYHFINKNVMDLVNAGYDSDDAERIALRAAKE